MISQDIPILERYKRPKGRVEFTDDAKLRKLKSIFVLFYIGPNS